MQHSLNPEDHLAITKVNDEAKLITDLFYRLSLSRRALIKPAFNTLVKKTADAIPADDFLFGSSFGEEIKKAATMEKSCRDMVNTSLAISKKVQQPIRPPTQPVLSRLEDSRAPEMEIVGDEEDRALSSNRRLSDRHRFRGSAREGASKCCRQIIWFSLQLEKDHFGSSDPSSRSRIQITFQVPSFAKCWALCLFVKNGRVELSARDYQRLLCIKGAIEHVLDCEGQFLSPFFIIKKSSRGWRFIFNLNCCSTFQNGRLENGYCLLSPSDFLASIYRTHTSSYLSVQKTENSWSFAFRAVFFNSRFYRLVLLQPPTFLLKFWNLYYLLCEKKDFSQSSTWISFLLHPPARNV